MSRRSRRPTPLSPEADGDTLHETAVRLLARREHAAAELVRKLGQRGFDAGDAEAEVRRLAQQGLQSDRRFTELYVEQRIRRGDGPAKIRAALGERGINGELIAELLDGGGTDWLARAREALERRFGTNRDGDHKARGQQARFLATRGYPADIARRAVDSDRD